MNIEKIEKLLYELDNDTDNYCAFQCAAAIRYYQDLSNELQTRYNIEHMKYNDLKQIEEAHRIENGELRDRIKQLEDIDKHIPHID